MSKLPTGYVRIIRVQAISDPWTGDVVEFVLYEDREGDRVVTLTEERCAELNLRQAVSHGRAIHLPEWRQSRLWEDRGA